MVVYRDVLFLLLLGKWISNFLLYQLIISGNCMPSLVYNLYVCVRMCVYMPRGGEMLVLVYMDNMHGFAWFCKSGKDVKINIFDFPC